MAIYLNIRCADDCTHPFDPFERRRHHHPGVTIWICDRLTKESGNLVVGEEVA